MGSAVAHAGRRAALSRHPAFAPIVTLWLAALLGGCIAVLPKGLVSQGLAQLPIALPGFAQSHASVANFAALTGGLLGALAARLIALAQSGGRADVAGQMAQFEDPPADQLEPLRIVELEEVAIAAEIAATAEPEPKPEPETEPAMDAWASLVAPQWAEPPIASEPEAAVEPEPQPASHLATPASPAQHGLAVSLLRNQPTQNLAMPQLIERFAVALDERRQHSHAHLHTYPLSAPSADMADRLRALLASPRQ